MLHCLPSDLDGVQTWELMEIMEYRQLQDADEKKKETERKDDAAREAVDRAAREFKESEAKAAHGPPVIGKKALVLTPDAPVEPE